jgi:hypothetical protein
MARAAQSEPGLGELRVIITACLFPVIFAGLAGYFMCFWSSKRTILRIFLAICLPTILALTLVLRIFFQLSQQRSYIFESQHSFTFLLKWLPPNVLKFPAGPIICSGGLLLILIYAIRLVRGSAKLPLSLTTENSLSADDADLQVFRSAARQGMGGGLTGMPPGWQTAPDKRCRPPVARCL